MNDLNPTITGSGHPVVLIHPLGADRSYWDFLLDSLPGRQLIAYDLPGHGSAADAGEQYSIRDLAQQLVTMITDLGLTSASLVGVSIGGLVAQAAASDCPWAVDHVSLIDTVPVYPPDFAANLEARAATILVDGVEPIVAPTLAMWFTSDYIDADGPGVGLVRTMLGRVSPQGYAHACHALVAADLTATTPSISQPTLIMCGSDDLPAFTTAATWLRDSIAGSQLTWLEGGRHGAVLECSDQVITALDAFLPRGDR